MYPFDAPCRFDGQFGSVEGILDGVSYFIGAAFDGNFQRCIGWIIARQGDLRRFGNRERLLEKLRSHRTVVLQSVSIGVVIPCGVKREGFVFAGAGDQMLGDFARVTHPVRLAELFYVGRDQRLIVGIGGIVRLTDYPQDISRLWIGRGAVDLDGRRGDFGYMECEGERCRFDDFWCRLRNGCLYGLRTRIDEREGGLTGCGTRFCGIGVDCKLDLLGRDGEGVDPLLVGDYFKRPPPSAGLTMR